MATPFNRDFAIAAGVLAGCLVVLGYAFSSPEQSPVDDPVAGVDQVGGPGRPGSGGQPSRPGSQDAAGDDDEDLIAIQVDPEPEEDIEDEPLATNDPPPLSLDLPADDEPTGDFRSPWDVLKQETPVTRRQDPEGTTRRERPDTTQEPEETPELPERREPAGAGAKTHVVAKGDTLSEISSRYYGTSGHWQAIQEANNGIEPYELQVGMQLKLPDLPRFSAERPDPKSSSGAGGYTVKKGDSYYTIARDQLGDASRFQEIQDLNDIDPYELKVGQKLKLPARSPGRSRSGSGSNGSTSSASRSSGDGDTYVVQKGDTLDIISEKVYGTSKRWRDIAAANDIADPTDLRVAQVLTIPGGRTTSGSTSTSTTRSPAATISRETLRAERGDGREYTIQKGDTFARLAQRFYGDENQHGRITQANPGVDPSNLKVGQTIWLPDVSGSGGSSSGGSGTSGGSPWDAVREKREQRQSGNTGGGSLRGFGDL